MTYVVANRMEAEHQEQHFGIPSEREQGLQCAREEAWSGPQAHHEFRGHRGGHQHLPPLQLCDGPEPCSPQGQPQDGPQSAQQAQTQGQEIAQIAKTVAQLVKGFEQMFGGGQGGAGGTGGAGGDGAAHHLAQNAAHSGGDQAASPASKSAQTAATDTSQGSSSLASAAKSVLTAFNSKDSGSGAAAPAADSWGADSPPLDSLPAAAPAA